MTIILKHYGNSIGEIVTGTWPTRDNLVHAFWRTESGFRSIESFDYSIIGAEYIHDAGTAEINCPECLAQLARWNDDGITAEVAA